MGQGHFGHAGRPGKHGGSAPKQSSLSPFEYVESLDPQLKASVVEYSTAGYKHLNKKLRKGEGLDESQQQLVKDVDKALVEAPPIKSSKVYRAVQASPEQMGMEVGKVYQEKTFLSTTSDSGYMYNLSGENQLKTRITIKVPKGTSGLHIERISHKPKEKEVLFPRDSKMKIVSINKDEFGNINVSAELL